MPCSKYAYYRSSSKLLMPSAGMVMGWNRNKYTNLGGNEKVFYTTMEMNGNGNTVLGMGRNGIEQVIPARLHYYSSMYK